jgi:2-phospho-L-lactate guanylyltransferase (CobY/MobA/RfbA family)
VLTGVSQKEFVAYMLDTVIGACSPNVEASITILVESADVGEATSLYYHHPWQ